jgi:PAS domain S-box-containing protein
VSSELGSELYSGTIDGEVDVRKQTVDALRQSEARFRCLIEQAADAFFVLDGEGRINEVNQAACDTLLYGREELLAMGLDDIEMNVTLDRYRMIWQTLEPGEPVTIAGVARRKDGSTLEVEVRVSLVQLDGYKQVFALVRDVTERRRVERDLIEAREAAIEASRLKSEFLANMSHEIRTPMNAVIGLTSLVLDTELSTEQSEYLQTVKSSASSLLTIIDDILDFSKIEAGKLELENTSFSMSSCVDVPFRTLAYRAQERKLDMTLDLPGDLPDAVIGDPGRLRQVLTNLLSNAIKFTERGGIILRVRHTRSGESAAEFHFSVTDTGIGIPREQLERIFDAFAQADGSATRRYGGTGLGLAICKRLTVAMGGRIWVESSPGEGSTFHVTVPLELDRNASGRLPDRDVVDHEREAGTERALRILIAEDSPVNRTLIELLLHKRGHDVVSVSNGSEAVSAARDESFDLIFMDVQMPVLDGFEATARIRQHELESGKRVPIVALTAHAMKGDRQRCLAEDMDDYLPKPIRTEDLWAVINRWAKPHDATRPSRAVLDTAHLTTQTGGDVELRGQLARIFVDEYPSLLQRLREGLTSRNATAIEKAAHRMKGSLATMGAFRAAGTGEQLETAAHHGDVSEAARISEDFGEQCDEVVLELEKMAWPVSAERGRG